MCGRVVGIILGKCLLKGRVLFVDGNSQMLEKVCRKGVHETLKP